jgi:hypothetical protein
MKEYANFAPELLRQFEAHCQNRNRLLKKIFDNEINGSFLISTKEDVLGILGEEIIKLYDFDFSEEKIWTGFDNVVDYEIGKMIVAVHHAHNLLNSKEDISSCEKNVVYKNNLVEQVTDEVRLRQYAARLFRQNPMMQGESFIYYPVPYLLFVFCSRISEIINQNHSDTPLAHWIYQIAYRSLATLTLMEDGFLGVAYSPCRTIIEDYLKLSLCFKNSSLFKIIAKFENYELEQSCCSQKFPEEFEIEYGKRKNKCKKSDYLHYGFVDHVNNYHALVKSNPYSIPGIIDYLKSGADNASRDSLEQLFVFYKMCHGYIHGAVIGSKYPQLHYFEISMILGEIVPRVYEKLCDEFGMEKTVNGIDVPGRFKEEFALLKEQYRERNTEKFEFEQGKWRR